MKLLSATTEVFFKKAVSVAEHYGFRNIDDLRFEASKRGTSVLDLEKQHGTHKHFEQHILRAVLEKCNQSVQLKKKQPLMFYTPSMVSHPSTPSVRISTLSLNAVGTADPLAEVVLIKSATSILEELGLKGLRVAVNSIGDNDSSARFIREITGLLRTRSSDLNETEILLLRTDPAALISELFTERHPITESMPSPLDFLTTPSRRHFKELLELLDLTGIPFDLDDRLYADQRVYSHTLFEIRDDSELDTTGPSQPLARGGRYDELTRPYVRGSVPSTGVVIAARTKNERTSTVGRPRRRKPNACLVHIGREARIRSIGIIETFRREKIPIEQCLQYERFSEQMAYAEAMHTKYIIIMGQREARDGVVLLRNAESRSQTTVRIDQLPGVFKGLTV
jgi:histidyl-tRNA synthetase